MLRSFPEWRVYALGAAFLTFLLGLLILGQMPAVRQTGYLVMGASSPSSPRAFFRPRR